MGSYIPRDAQNPSGPGTADLLSQLTGGKGGLEAAMEGMHRVSNPSHC